MLFITAALLFRFGPVGICLLIFYLGGKCVDKGNRIIGYTLVVLSLIAAGLWLLDFYMEMSNQNLYGGD